MMTKAQFDAEVTGFMHVDGTRRGLETFRASFIRSGILDLSSYITRFKGQAGLSGGTLTTLDTEAAEAVAEFVKSRIARVVDRDIALSREHQSSYVSIRRRLFLRTKGEATTDLYPLVGKPYTISFTAMTGAIPIRLIGEVWFTVKSSLLVADADATIRLTRGEDCGVEVIDEDAGTFTISATAEQTGALMADRDYIWEVQAQGDDNVLVTPDMLFGTVRPRIPLTRDNPSCST